MRKFIQRTIYLIICTVFLSLIAIMSYISFTDKQPSFSFLIDGNRFDFSVKVHNAENGNYYVFLPSYVRLDQVKFVSSSKKTISLDGNSLSDGFNCSTFKLDTKYKLSIDGQNSGTLQFLKSENTAALFIDTESGNMNHIHKSKEYSEASSIALIDKNGLYSYFDSECEIKGRGNSTWSYEKKPYSLTLSKEEPLLGMDSSANWILLANAMDETNLRNKLISELACRVGLEWTPHCEYVDVYLNGTYSGLYLLSEKIEVSVIDPEIDTSSGDFLCKIELPTRRDKLKHPIETTNGRVVEIVAPDPISSNELIQIEDAVNTLEQAIVSGNDLSHMDKRSWILRYLIDETTGNSDSDWASSYFYLSDGVFYAGPLWDYDLTFGNVVRNENRELLVSEYTYNINNIYPIYHRALCNNKSFMQDAKKIYFTELLPVLEQMAANDIYALSESISSASKMNSIRWESMFLSSYENGEVIHTTTDSIVFYLTRKMDFLSDVWLEGRDYCTVRLEQTPGNPYKNIMVERGEFLDASHTDLSSSVWLYADTLELFDPSLPITEDTVLISENAPDTPLVLREIAAIMSIFVIVFLFACFVVIDIRRHRRERSIKYERS